MPRRSLFAPMTPWVWMTPEDIRAGHKVPTRKGESDTKANVRRYVRQIFFRHELDDRTSQAVRPQR